MKKKYSVLMSVYYKENPVFFDLSIKSMIDQALKPDEIVIVEDGELTPELYEVIDKYKLQYKNLIKSLKFKKNQGLGIALKEGLKVTKNEIVARMDTDDIAKVYRCEKQMEYLLNNPSCAIVGGQIQEFIDDPTNLIGERIVPTTDVELKKYLKKRCPFNHMTVMFRKKDVLDSGNYEDFHWNEDYCLWIKMALHNKQFANLPDVLVSVRVGKDMYKRRGGYKYFKSEKAIQKFMLKEKIIGKFTYFANVLKRFILQIVLPNGLRQFVFKKFARRSISNEK